MKKNILVMGGVFNGVILCFCLVIFWILQHVLCISVNEKDMVDLAVGVLRYGVVAPAVIKIVFYIFLKVFHLDVIGYSVLVQVFLGVFIVLWLSKYSENSVPLSFYFICFYLTVMTLMLVIPTKLDGYSKPTLKNFISFYRSLDDYEKIEPNFNVTVEYSYPSLKNKLYYSYSNKINLFFMYNFISTLLTVCSIHIFNITDVYILGIFSIGIALNEFFQYDVLVTNIKKYNISINTNCRMLIKIKGIDGFIDAASKDIDLETQEVDTIIIKSLDSEFTKLGCFLVI